ncbi:hypothetical protein NXF25_011592 [Crotalus adamanteus]
MPESCQI